MSAAAKVKILFNIARCCFGKIKCSGASSLRDLGFPDYFPVTPFFVQHGSEMGQLPRSDAVPVYGLPCGRLDPIRERQLRGFELTTPLQFGWLRSFPSTCRFSHIFPLTGRAWHILEAIFRPVTGPSFRAMKILLYNPDNGISNNFMPHLWMFLLKSITPPEHEVLLQDGNARPMNDGELAGFAKERGVRLVGIGAMTRMIARAYRAADALRTAGIPVVMGGPHVTELPDEALGRSGGPRHADAVALGEADETWPRIVEDAANGRLKDIYAPLDVFGQGKKPNLDAYPKIPWESMNLDQFNQVPRFLRRVLGKIHCQSFHLIPIESGRGCPYGCEFCTVTGFFGDSIRFRTNESVVDEMLRLKTRAMKDNGKIAVFFVDDNFALNVKRTKSLLRAIIAAHAQINWVAQISANLLRDEELVDLIAESGGKWIFIGMESLDPENLKDVNKSFSKPGEYAPVLDRLAKRNVYAITSFIFGLDNDTLGVAARTLAHIREWPPGLPVFGQITPFPSTPLYNRLLKDGRLTRPTHWLDFGPFEMAHTPLKMTAAAVDEEIKYAWTNTYSPENTWSAIRKISGAPAAYQLSHLIARLCFRGIYFPQKGSAAWFKVLLENRRVIFRIMVNCLSNWKGSGIPEPLALPQHSDLG